MGFLTLERELPRVGVLGASRIVRTALLQEAAGVVEVCALGARDLSRARAFADEAQIPKAYGSYEELICDPDIDIIYNALPASGHAPWSARALRAGKHVLCEKPFGLHVDEAKELAALAERERRLLMEAHHWRFHPLVAEAEAALVNWGRLDGPISVEAQFFASLNNPGDIRLDPLLGPGVLMDFGCYTLKWCCWIVRALLGEDSARAPSIKRSEIIEGAPGVDLRADVEMEFGAREERELAVRFACDMRDGTPFRAFVRLSSGDKRLHFENPLNVNGAHLLLTDGDKEERIEPHGHTTYGGQLRAFVRALRTGVAPKNTGNEIIETQALLDDCYRKAGVINRRDLRQKSLEVLTDSARRSGERGDSGR